jgi:tetratricopeptide (TPR) repeat protein
MNSETGRGIAVMGNSDAFFRVAPYIHEAVQKARGWKSVTEPHRAGDAVALALALRGTQAALDTYHRLKRHAIAGYTPPDEGTLNQLGYTLLRDKKQDDAIKVFQLNVQEYPQGSNCYDSLAEAYMTAGQRDLAIKNYEKSLELNPKNENAVKMLKKLKSQ